MTEEVELATYTVDGLHILSDTFRPLGVQAIVDAGGEKVIVGGMAFGVDDARLLAARIIEAADTFDKCREVMR